MSAATQSHLAFTQAAHPEKNTKRIEAVSYLLDQPIDPAGRHSVTSAGTRPESTSTEIDRENDIADKIDGWIHPLRKARSAQHFNIYLI